MAETAGDGADRAAPDGEDLEALPTKELHDRALRYAERHLDVRFFWRLMQVVPAAKAAGGDVGEADYDIQFSKGIITDAVSSDEATAEALRPLYIEYLRKHPRA